MTCLRLTKQGSSNRNNGKVRQGRVRHHEPFFVAFLERLDDDDDDDDEDDDEEDEEDDKDAS